MAKQNSKSTYLPAERVAYYREKIDAIMTDFHNAMNRLRRDRRDLVARIRKIEDEKRIGNILGQ